MIWALKTQNRQTYPPQWASRTAPALSGIASKSQTTRRIKHHLRHKVHLCQQFLQYPRCSPIHSFKPYFCSLQKHLHCLTFLSCFYHAHIWYSPHCDSSMDLHHSVMRLRVAKNGYIATVILRTSVVVDLVTPSQPSASWWICLHCSPVILNSQNIQNGSVRQTVVPLGVNNKWTALEYFKFFCDLNFYCLLPSRAVNSRRQKQRAYQLLQHMNKKGEKEKKKRKINDT